MHTTAQMVGGNLRSHKFIVYLCFNYNFLRNILGLLVSIRGMSSGWELCRLL